MPGEFALIDRIRARAARRPDVVRSVQGFHGDGITGPLSFDRFGDVSTDAVTVYRVQGGEVTGAVNNFRWNESPVDLLRRFTTASGTVPSFSREWGDEYFSRTATPALRIPDFHMSSVSQAL